MKKVSYILLVICLSVFIGIQNIDAKDLTGSVYFENSGRSDLYRKSINLFEDTKKYSPFVELLYNQGFYIGQYLDNYFNIGNVEFFNDQYLYSISIFTPNDLDFITLAYQANYNAPGYTRYASDYEDGYFKNEFLAGNYLDGYSQSDVAYIISFNLKNYSDYAFVTEDNFYFYIYPRYVFYFDSSGTPIGYRRFVSNDTSYWGNSYSDYTYKTEYKFVFDFDNSDKPDMTSWYFYLYFNNVGNTFSSEVYSKIYPKYFYFDGSFHTTDNNAGYNSITNFWNFVSSGFSDFQIDFSKWNMQFIYDDVFYKVNIKFVPLMKRWNDSSSYIVPSGYSMVDISDSEKGYYFNVKEGCKTDDYLLYFSSDSSLDRHKLYFTYYNFIVNDDDQNDIEFYKSFYTVSNKSFKIYSYNPLIDLSVSKSELSDYVFNVTQSSLVISYKIYYNSNCYSPVLASNSSITLSFSSGNVVLDNNALNDNFSKNNITQYYTGGNIVSSGSSGSSSNTPSEDNSSSINFSNIISNAGTYASNFINSISALVGLATIFLVGLPAEIYQVLIAIFTIGLIVILIKLIH